MGSATPTHWQGARTGIARITVQNRISFTFCEADLLITVGRDSSCTVHLPYAHVSRHHCEITRSDGQLSVRDTSTNGIEIEIEGMLIRGGEAPLRGTMTLSFAGQTSFKLTAFAVATPAPPNRDRFDRRAGERARRADVTSWGIRETLSLDKLLVTDPDD